MRILTSEEIKLWDQYALAALHGAGRFTGDTDNVAEFVSEVADAMLNERDVRLGKGDNES